MVVGFLGAITSGFVSVQKNLILGTYLATLVPRSLYNYDFGFAAEGSSYQHGLRLTSVSQLTVPYVIAAHTKATSIA